MYRAYLPAFTEWLQTEKDYSPHTVAAYLRASGAQMRPVATTQTLRRPGRRPAGTHAASA